MKKNKTLRIALVLCVLAIFCACLVGSTFAKYVTGSDTKDTARVSKWGVTVTYEDLDDADDVTFSKQYAIEDTNASTAGITLAVKSEDKNGNSDASDDDNMVAPGTEDAGFKFTIAGTPEVATKVDIHMTVNKDIFLGVAGDYAAAEAVAHADYTDTANYYPLVFTLTATDADAFGTGVNTVSGNLKLIEETLETWAAGAYNEPNTDLAETFTLTWAWEYGEYDAADDYTDATDADVADTKLGDLADGVYDATYTSASAGTNYCTEVDFEIRIIVTQMN